MIVDIIRTIDFNIDFHNIDYITFLHYILKKYCIDKSFKRNNKRKACILTLSVIF